MLKFFFQFVLSPCLRFRAVPALGCPTCPETIPRGQGMGIPRSHGPARLWDARSQGQVEATGGGSSGGQGGIRDGSGSKCQRWKWNSFKAMG